MNPRAIGPIGWRVFIIFAVLNPCWVPIVYIFFPETANLSFEDVDHLFEKGGITGGVWGSSGGHTVIAHSDRLASASAAKSERDEKKAGGAGGEVEHMERHSGSMSGTRQAMRIRL